MTGFSIKPYLLIQKTIVLFGILTIVIFSIPTTSHAQYWMLRKIDNDQGISNSAVTSIFLDSRQYMWFGTWDGLNRYDGKHAQVFMPDRTVKTSIGNNIIREIFEDKNKTLWIVTDKNINKYDPNTASFQVFLNSDDFPPGRERVIRSSIGKDSSLWCSIFNVGIVHYSNQTNEFIQIKDIRGIGESLRKIIGIKAFSKQRLALLSENGDLITLIKEDDWMPVRIDSLSTIVGVLPNDHWFMDFQGKPVLLMALEDGGLVYVDLNSGSSQKVASGNSDFIITEISKSTGGEFLWLGTDNGKILKLFFNNKLTIENLDHLFPELTSERVKILKIYEVYPDLLWIGTDGNGIMEYNTKGTPFSSIKKGNTAKGELGHNIVRAIYEEPTGQILVGTRGGGLNILDTDLLRTKLITTEEGGLSNNAVLAIERDSHQNYWIGLDGEGLDFLESESGNLLHFPEDFMNDVDLTFKSVYTICIDSYDDIWLGTSGHGIIKLRISKRGTGKYTLDKYEQFLNTPSAENNLKSNIVYSIREDRPNFLWIGSRGGGVQQLNTLTNEFSDIGNQIDSDVISLYKSNSYEELWVGTSSGLYKVSLKDKNYNFDLYNVGNGLPNNTIHAVQEDDFGNIWVSTNGGLSLWNRKLNQFRSYNKNDGLAGNEYADGASFFGKKTKRIYFGGTNGLTIIEPEKVKNSTDFPRLALQELKVFNKLVAPANSGSLLRKHIDDTDTLIFESDQNFFSISYAALNFSNNEKSEYAYYLDGFDKDWNYMGTERTAYFTNVLPGEYTLKLKCSNQDGIWNESYRSILIIVRPSIWRTSEAFLVYAITALLFSVLIYSFLKKRTRIKKQLYLAQLDKQNIEEINNYKLRFFTNVSHEFRTPLSLILFPANKLFENKDKYPDLKSSFESIYYNSNRLLKLIGELIEFRKAEADQIDLAVSEGDLSSFIEQITIAFSSYAEEHNISILLEPDSNDPAPAWFDHDKIKTIVINLISNAIKYNRPDGVVTVSVSVEDDEALIKVEDTGIGIAEDFLDKVFQRFFNKPSEGEIKTDPAHSSGIGLALTKSLVESHKGNISVSSKEDEGSIFYVRFPINKEAYTGCLVEQAIQQDPLVIEQNIDTEFTNFHMIKAEAIASKQIFGNRYCLLIVDDNIQFRTIIKNMFALDYDIIEASDGAEAIEIMKENHIDLIISDVLMPVIDGYELCERVKDDINTSHIPIILLTAMGEIENRIKGIDIGADSYIPKPFHPKHLTIRVEKLLESKENIRKSFENTPWKLAESVNGLAQKDKIWLGKIVEFIVGNMSNSDLDSDLLVEEFAMSKTQLYRKIKSVTGNTPHGFIKKYRLKKAAELLINSDRTISEITYEIGMNNRSYFYRIFKEEYDCSPSDFRNKTA